MSQFIEFRREARRLILPIQILAPWPTSLDAVVGTALIDTGSTTSGIRAFVARKLNLSGLGKRPMGTIGGEIQIERYTFRIGMIVNTNGAPSFPFVFEETLGFELREGFAFDALIGMDLLSQCDLTMRRDGMCRLSFGQ